MTHIVQSMKRSYLFEEIVQTMRRYIAVCMHTAHYFRNSFHFDQGEDNLTPDKNHRVRVSLNIIKICYIKEIGLQTYNMYLMISKTL